MAFQWSSHAAHIQSVFSPWQEQDGYPLAIIEAAEQALGLPLPALLKNFYLAWGRRTDLTRTRETMLNPDQLTVRSGGVIFAEENQAVYVWAIPCTALHSTNPPVYAAELTAEPDDLHWTPSHRHLSDFLDYVAYGHALAHGAPHGGVAHERCTDALQNLIVQYWHPIEIASVQMGFLPDPAARWVVHGGPGVVLDCEGELWVATRTVALREMVRERLHLTWKTMW